MNNALATTEGEAETPKKPIVSRKLALLAAPLLIAVLMCGLWFSGVATRFGIATGNQTGSVAEKPTLIDVPDIVTNLDSGSHRAVFIKLKARIEVPFAKDETIISSNMPQILDAFHTYLRSMRPEELHGGEGGYRLREALMTRIDAIAAPVQVRDVLFVEMLIQ